MTRPDITINVPYTSASHPPRVRSSQSWATAGSIFSPTRSSSRSGEGRPSDRCSAGALAVRAAEELGRCRRTRSVYLPNQAQWPSAQGTGIDVRSGRNDGGADLGAYFPASVACVIAEVARLEFEKGSLAQLSGSPTTFKQYKSSTDICRMSWRRDTACRRSVMVVTDKTDGVCGAANQGPEGGPSSPCARVPRLVFNSHSSRSSAASE